MKMKFLTTYRDIAGCRETEIPAPQNVKALLEALVSLYGDPMRKKLLDADGELLEDAVLLVNGKHISLLSGIDTTLSDDDKVSLFSAVAAG